MKTCPVCGKAFKPRNSKQRTCSRVCGQARRVEAAKVTCPICGRRFIRAKKTTRFCSNKCYGRYRSQCAELAEARRKQRDFFATKEQLEELYHGHQLTQEEIAAHFGVTQKKVWGLMRYYGIRARAAAKRHQNGALNHAWKGGQIRMGKYRYVIRPDHPNATKAGYLAEHILVATETLGRPLSEDECVHHLDGDKDNNQPDNLYVTTKHGHGQLHRQLEAIAFALYRAGFICFTDGRYRIADKLMLLCD